jgi:hypothetical protein
VGAAGPERRQLAASDARSLRARRASMLSSERSSATAIGRRAARRLGEQATALMSGIVASGERTRVGTPERNAASIRIRAAPTGVRARDSALRRSVNRGRRSMEQIVQKLSSRSGRAGSDAAIPGR